MRLVNRQEESQKIILADIANYFLSPRPLSSQKKKTCLIQAFRELLSLIRNQAGKGVL